MKKIFKENNSKPKINIQINYIQNVNNMILNCISVKEDKSVIGSKFGTIIINNFRYIRSYFETTLLET
jgi:hypothetical protein